jgi:hypothetical protein
MTAVVLLCNYYNGLELIEDPKITHNVGILEIRGLEAVDNHLNYDVTRWSKLTTVWVSRTVYDCEQGQCYVREETTTRYDSEDGDEDGDSIILTDVGITLITCLCVGLCGGGLYASRHHITRLCACCRRSFRGGVTLGGISFGQSTTNNSNLIELTDNQANSSSTACESSVIANSGTTDNRPTDSNALLNPPAGSSTPICHPIPIDLTKAPKKPPRPSFIVEDDSTFSLYTPSNNRSSSSSSSYRPKNLSTTPKPWPRTSTLSTTGLLLRQPKSDTCSQTDSGFDSFPSATNRRPRKIRHFDDIDENGTFYHY